MTALSLAALWLLVAAHAAPPDTVDLVVAATTDVHGHLRGWDYDTARPDSAVGSLARAATVVDSLRRAAPGRVVLLDAGDMLQGTVLTDVAARDATRPHPVIAAMNAMRYDAAAVGNHEFNYGFALVRRAAREARFPLLAANAVPGGTWHRTPFADGRTVERAGVRVGIVGATTPGSMVWDRDHLRGNVALRDVVPALRRAAAEARRAGADVVVAVLHSGLDEPSSYDTTASGVASENVVARVAREVPGVDLVVFGHSHQQLADTTIGGALVMQPKYWAASVAVAYAAAPLGRTDVAWRADSARVADAAVTDFILETMRRRAGTDLAATAVFSTAAGLRSGAITVADVARLYPYENTLRAVRVTGAQLRAFLEQSSRYYAPAPNAPGTTDPRVVRDAAGRPLPGVADDTLIARGGLRIGVVGLATPETPATTRAVNVRGLTFSPLAPAADARVRAAPDHCTGEIVDFARALTKPVDAIVSGHTHSLVGTVVNGIPIVQARSGGRALGVIDVSLDSATGRPRPAGARLVSATVGDRPIDDGRLYTVVLNDVLVTGGDGLGLAAGAAAVTPLNVVDLDALVGYLRQLPQPVRPLAGARIRSADR